MAYYELAILSCSDLALTIRELRKLSPLGVSELRQRIAAHEIVLSIDSFDGPVDMVGKERVAHQHRVFRSALDNLRTLGNEVVLQYRASDRSEPEAVTDQMLANLMESQLESYDQWHD